MAVLTLSMSLLMVGGGALPRRRDERFLGDPEGSGNDRIRLDHRGPYGRPPGSNRYVEKRNRPRVVTELLRCPSRFMEYASSFTRHPASEPSHSLNPQCAAASIPHPAAFMLSPPPNVNLA